MLDFLKILCRAFRRALWSRYKWMFILFGIWLYRVECIPDTGSGLPKVLQIGSMVLLALLMLQRFPSSWTFSYGRTNISVRSCLWLYSFAVLSTLWAFLPSYTLYMAAQNIVLMVALVVFCSYKKTFREVEDLFVLSVSIILVLLFFAYRLLGSGLISHNLSLASTAAILISYASAEWMSMKKKDGKRKMLLRNAIYLSLFVLITNTSSGANASALFGIFVALLFSRKVFWASLALLASAFLYFNQDLIDGLILLIMPGKTMETIQTASGREYLWEHIWTLIHQRPIQGWGYAGVERAVTTLFDFPAIDAHNIYLGILGGMGVLGCCFLGWHIFQMVTFCVKRHKRPGFTGLLAASACAYLNGYSYGFLSGKACCITVAYFMLVVLSWVYANRPRYA